MVHLAGCLPATHLRLAWASSHHLLSTALSLHLADPTQSQEEECKLRGEEGMEKEEYFGWLVKYRSQKDMYWRDWLIR